MTVAVLTISDRASRGVYPDRSGPRIEAILRERLPGAAVRREVVPDEPEAIRAALERHREADFILTTGGTGLSPRDVTPQVSEAFCERALPGIAEALRRESARETPYAMLSRGFAGMKGRTIVVNFPGSPAAAELCTRTLLPVMAHARRMLAGEGHGPPPAGAGPSGRQSPA